MADFISNLINNLTPSPSVTIGVSVTQSGLLEVCTYDKATHAIKSYANRTIKYNAQKREVEDYEEFKINLLSMYQELDIPNKCSVVLSLPNVFFDITSVPLILEENALENVLLGEIEQSYIFKKNEPISSWIELGKNERSDNRNVAYCAIQKTEAEEFLRVFKEIGSKLLTIDNAYYNMINAIPYTQIAKKEIETNAPWNIVLVTNNNYVIFSMRGAKLSEFIEEPIALRSISSVEESYTSLSESINASLQTYIANSILVISDSDEIDAQKLCETINFHGQKIYLNQNSFATGQIIETDPTVLPNYISAITIYSVGSAIYPYLEEDKRFNLMPETTSQSSSSTSDTCTLKFGDMEIEVSSATIQALAIILVVFLLAIYGGIYFYMINTDKKIDAQIQDVDNQTSQITQELKTLKESQTEDGVSKIFDLPTAKKEISENNKNSILYYNLLSFNIPRSTWITHFYTDSKGAIAIEGKTSSTNNVYLFFKGIKATMSDSDLALTKLKYSQGFEDEIAYTNRVLYDFELSNAQYSTVEQPTATPFDITAQTDESLEETKDKIQKKVDKQTNKKEKTPDLPPIEDIKTDKNTEKATKNQRLNKEDVEQQQGSKGSKNSTKDKKETNSGSPELPELPNLEE